MIGRAIAVRADSANLADLDRLYEKVKSVKGHIDIVFASAGGGEVDKPIGSMSEKLVDDTLNLIVRGTLFTVQKALPLMREGGSIILNASNAHLKGFSMEDFVRKLGITRAAFHKYVTLGDHPKPAIGDHLKTGQ